MARFSNSIQRLAHEVTARELEGLTLEDRIEIQDIIGHARVRELKEVYFEALSDSDYYNEHVVTELYKIALGEDDFRKFYNYIDARISVR